MFTLMKNATKSLITSTLGLLFILAGVASVFLNETMTWWDASIVIAIGVLLIFSPDTVILKASLLFTKQKESIGVIEEVMTPAAEPLIEEEPYVEVVKAKSGPKKKNNVSNKKPKKV